jgi:hypothetical protein
VAVDRASNLNSPGDDRANHAQVAATRLVAVRRVVAQRLAKLRGRNAVVPDGTSDRRARPARDPNPAQRVPTRDSRASPRTLLGRQHDLGRVARRGGVGGGAPGYQRRAAHPRSDHPEAHLHARRTRWREEKFPTGVSPPPSGRGGRTTRPPRSLGGFVGRRHPGLSTGHQAHGCPGAVPKLGWWRPGGPTRRPSRAATEAAITVSTEPRRERFASQRPDRVAKLPSRAVAAIHRTHRTAPTPRAWRRSCTSTGDRSQESATKSVPITAPITGPLNSRHAIPATASRCDTAARRGRSK